MNNNCIFVFVKMVKTLMDTQYQNKRITKKPLLTRNQIPRIFFKKILRILFNQ